MVSQEHFKDKVREFCELVNISAKSNAVTALAIYDRIKNDYINVDVTRAFEDMIEGEIKLSFPICRRYLNKHRDIRANIEAQQRRMQDRTDVKQTMMSDSQVADIVAMILGKKPDTLPKSDYIKPNATIRAKDGKDLAVWIDTKDPNYAYGKAISVRYEQRGEHAVRICSINLDMVNHRILTGRSAPLKAVDDDFIPELEIPDAIQESLGLDGQATDHA